QGESRIARARRAIVARAVAEGHLVGNHTVTHVHLCHADAAAADAEIDAAGDLFARASGLPLVLFRSPYGSRCPRLDAALARRGLRHVYWDIDPQEFLGKGPRETARIVIDALRDLRGRAVIL